MAQDKINAAVAQQIALLDPFLLSQRQVLKTLAEHLVATFHQGGRLFLVGSGPFGSIAGLIGQSFLHRQALERPALALAGVHLSPADREALGTASQLGCRSILIASEQVDLADILPDISLSLPSDSLPRLQENTLFIGNLLCAMVEGELFGT